MRRNRTIELAGVNAFRTLVEAAGHIYQPVNLENDIGKDGYLDVTDEDGGISTCVAVQVKSGLSYRHGDNYKIPASRAHRDLWSSSPLPVIGVVYDPDREQLLWVNLTHELRSGRAAASGAIVVPATNVLTATTLRTAVVASATAERRISSGAGSLTLYVADQRQQIAAVWDQFAIGRHDGRALLLLRDATRSLTGDPLRAALRALAHLAPYHPDIWWHESNIVPEPIRTTIGDQLQWPADDLARVPRRLGLGRVLTRPQWPGPVRPPVPRPGPSWQAGVDRVGVSAIRQSARRGRRGDTPGSARIR